MKKGVLVVIPHHASFIDQDIDILRNEYDVTVLEYRKRRDRFALLRALRRVRVAVAWFVLGYAYAMVRLTALHRARTVLIPGGWDVDFIPELKYGTMSRPRTINRTAYALTHADRVLAVSEFTHARVKKWAPAANSRVLYHGFDGGTFTPGSRRRRGVVTVSRLSSETWELKGLHVFAETARRLPNLDFAVVGQVSEPDIVRRLPENVKILGLLTQERIVEVFQSAKVYAQLSAVESFGCAVAEAMLSGCLPVVTDRGAIPEVVGGEGRRVPYGNVDLTVRAVLEAHASQDGRTCRERILDKFPLSKRKDELLEEIQRVGEGER